MKITDTYLETLPLWMREIIKEKSISEIFDAKHDMGSPIQWDKFPDFRISRPYSDGETPFLVEDLENGNINFTGDINGEITTWYNCNPHRIVVSGLSISYRDDFVKKEI